MKGFTLFVLLFILINSASAQYIVGPSGLGNPKNLNKENPVSFDPSSSNGWTNIINSSQSAPVWSSSQSIPFNFHFNGTLVNSYKVSSTGVVNFIPATLPTPLDSNYTLPNVHIPDFSVCILGINASGTNDGVKVKSMGTAPNRQLWISFYSMSGNNFSFFYGSIVFQESSNEIYIVEESFPTGSSANLTLGIQVNSTSAVMVNGSPNYNPTHTDFNYQTNKYYSFIPMINVDSVDLAMEKMFIDDKISSYTPTPLYGEFRNMGFDTVHSFTFNYQVNNGIVHSEPFVGLNLPLFEVHSFSSGLIFQPPVGTHILKFWMSNINGQVDQNTSNDTLTKSIEVYPHIFSPINNTYSNFDSISHSFGQWGDYNDDGKLDLLLTDHNGFAGHNILLYKNINNGFFEKTNNGALYAGSAVDQISWVDIDNDGDLDVFVPRSYFPNGGSYFFENDGNGHFSQLNGVNFPGTASSFDGHDWADYDLDGDDDIIITIRKSQAPNEIYLFENNGDNSFTIDTNAHFSFLENVSFSWGDYNNDGYPDIAMIGAFDSVSTTWLYRNNGGNSFSPVNTDTLESLFKGDVQWGDYDNDGDLDLSYTGAILGTTKHVTKVLRNDGNDQFTHITAQIDSLGFGRVRWGDFNNDGLLDFVNCGKNSTFDTHHTHLYMNMGNNSFTKVNEPLLEGVASTAEWVDSDNDGDLDLFLGGISKDTSGTEYKFSGLYRNNSPTLNLAPSTPIITFNPYSNIVSWNASTDDHTPSSSITYNMEITKIGDSINILSGLSDPLTGQRKVLKRGNMQFKTHINLSSYGIKLDSSYLIKVQSVDNAFLASPYTSVQAIPSIGGYIIADKTSISCSDSAHLNVMINYPNQGSYSYTWTSSEPISNTTSKNPFAMPTQSAWYKVIISLNNIPVCSDSIFLSVVSPDYNLDFSSPQTTLISAPYLATFNNATPDQNKYDFLWDFGDGNILPFNNTTLSYNYLNSGSYTVSLIAEEKNTACFDTLTKQNHITCGPNSISQMETNKLGISVWPNPAKDFVVLTMNSMEHTDMSLFIYNSSGQMVLEQKLLGANQSWKVDISELSSGIYIFRIEDIETSKQSLLRVIKQ